MKFRQILSVLLFGAAVLTSCKKEKEEATPQPDANTLVQAEDNNELKSESDQSNSEVTDAVSNFSTINGRLAATQGKKIICGCSIDSLGEKTIRLVYDGVTPCGSPSRTRSGRITVQLVNGTRWAQEGAVLSIGYDNFKVVRLMDQKSWNFNGTKTMTNVRGTNWIGFLAGTDSLLYRERGKGLTVNINNSSNVNYNLARTTTWKTVRLANRSFIQFAAIGDTTIEGLKNVDTWGISRFQNAFTNQYLSRLVSDTYCQLWRPTFGVITHRSAGNTLTLTFGVNESGQPDTRDCAYGWKINWSVAAGSQGERIYSY